MLRRILLGNRQPPLWQGIFGTTILFGLDTAWNLPVLATNGILIAILGGFYHGKDLQKFAGFCISGLLLASVVNWGQPENLGWWRLFVMALCGVVIYCLRFPEIADYLAAKQSPSFKSNPPSPAANEESNIEANLDRGAESNSEPGTAVTGSFHVETGFWTELSDKSSAPSDKFYSPPITGAPSNRTRLLVRLIDTGIMNRDECETVASILHDAPNLEMGLERCVLYGKLTGFQAECFADNAERRLRVGRYTLLGELGQGGMGTVYRALDRSRKEEVALKLFQNLGQHLLFIRREMSILQELAHPNLVTAYDVGDSDGYHYIAMEMLKGQTLQEIISPDRTMSEPEALEAILQVARAMQHMHERGVVHRDIKPSNVMRLASGRYKLMDLGICRPSGRLREFDSIDLGDSQTFGTIGYAAPEQLDRDGEVDFRSDYYSLGSLLFFLLSGKCYLRGRSLRERLHTLLVERDMRDLDDFHFSDEVTELLSRLLSYEPGSRPQNDSETLVAIQNILNNLADTQKDCRIAVLVVEDNEVDFTVTERILNRTNRSVDLLYSPTFSGVFEVLAQHPPCERRPMIVLLDLNLPDSTMDQTLAGLSEMSRERTGVIAISGDDSPETRKRCLNAGALDFISKNDLDNRSLEQTIFATASRLLTDPTPTTFEDRR